MGCIATEQEISKMQLHNINLCDKYVAANSNLTRDSFKNKDSSFSRHYLGFGGKFVMDKELKNIGNMKGETNNFKSDIALSRSPAKSKAVGYTSPTKEENILMPVKALSPERKNSRIKIVSPNRSPRSVKKNVRHDSPKEIENDITEAHKVKEEYRSNHENADLKDRVEVRSTIVQSNSNQRIFVLVEEDGAQVEDDIKFEETPIEDLANEVFIEINKIRADPPSYASKVQRVKGLIEPAELADIKNKTINYYLATNWLKSVKQKIKLDKICNVGLQYGQEGFDSLLNIINSYQSMCGLTFQNELCMEIPDKLSLVGNREQVSNHLNRVSSQGFYKELTFHYDIGIKNAIISAVLQFVDDSPFKKLRSRNILNSSKKYVGITAKEISGVVCLYFVFAE